MTLEQTTDHNAEALNQLLEQFKSKPRIEALISAKMIQVQEIEAVLFDIRDKLVLAVAVGDQLDIFGKIVTEPRLGKSDPTYLAFVLARILINRSNGRIEEINAVIKLITEATTGGTWRIDEFPPASMVLEETTDAGSVFDLDAILQLFESMTGGGIGAQVVSLPSSQTATPHAVFTFADADVAQPSNSRGLGNVSVTTGGRLTDAIDL